MGQSGWLVVALIVFVIWEWRFQLKAREELRGRVLDLEIRLHKLQEHLGFVADASRPDTDDVMILARFPGAKIDAIRLYRRQTGAGLKESKDAVERMMGSD